MIYIPKRSLFSTKIKVEFGHGKRSGKRAFNYFIRFCCSEAISKTIIDRFSDNPDGYPVKLASGFCGGIGRSHEDVCGALAGGVIAVGYLLGRMEQGKDLSKACEVITEFRKSFIGAFGSTNCAAILKSLANRKIYQMQQLTGKAAENWRNLEKGWFKQGVLSGRTIMTITKIIHGIGRTWGQC